MGRWASEQGPLQAQRGEEQHQAPGPCPAARCRAAYHFHRGGFGRVHVRAVTSRLSHNGLPFTGGLSVCCVKKRKVEGDSEERRIQRDTTPPGNHDKTVDVDKGLSTFSLLRFRGLKKTNQKGLLQMLHFIFKVTLYSFSTLQ